MNILYCSTIKTTIDVFAKIVSQSKLGLGSIPVLKLTLVLPEKFLLGINLNFSITIGN